MSIWHSRGTEEHLQCFYRFTDYFILLPVSYLLFRSRIFIILQSTLILSPIDLWSPSLDIAFMDFVNISFYSLLDQWFLAPNPGHFGTEHLIIVQSIHFLRFLIFRFILPRNLFWRQMIWIQFLYWIWYVEMVDTCVWLVKFVLRWFFKRVWP